MQETHETPIRLLGQEDALEKEMADHSSIPAWTEEPGGLWSVRSHRVGTQLKQLSTLFTLAFVVYQELILILSLYQPLWLPEGSDQPGGQSWPGM